MNRTVENNGIYSIDDLQISANKKLPVVLREYFNEGAMDLITLKENSTAFNQYRIRPRILVDVTNVNMTRTFLGRKCSFPLGLSPSAFHRLAHPEGELATSRAAAKAGIPMALSTYATTSVEDVTKQGEAYGNPYAMQLSVMKSKEANLSILRRAEKAGCGAVFVTVDCAVLGRRLNEARNDFKIPEHLDLPNLPEDIDWRDVAGTDDRLKYDAALSWKDLVEWARASTKMEIWLKGVYTAEDVMLAIDHGIDGVIVSNHGGRQLDSVTATLDALPECVAAAAGRIPVHIDGGFRRGTDIFKALALGAAFCWIGRPVLWGLAHNGEAGVSQAIKLLKDEFETAMALAGCATVGQITRGHLARRGPEGRMAKL